MENIDVHRRKKIHVFAGNIADAEKEIIQIQGFMRDPKNHDQKYFYQNRIVELGQKIQENQEFIDSIYRRMGIEPPPALSSLQLNPESQGLSNGELLPIQEESERALSEGQSE